MMQSSLSAPADHAPPAIPAMHRVRIPHTLLEDAYALGTGVLFLVFGLILLKAGSLLTGGVAGIALLVSYVMAQKVGVMFMLINVPFFLFGYFLMGPRFTVKSLIGSALVMGLLQIASHTFTVAYIHPAVAAVAGGTFCGMGILAFARHGAGVGGTGIVTLWIQKKYGLNAGYSQIALDISILLAGALVMGTDRIGWSVLSAMATSAMIMAWHRPGRYLG